MKNRLQDITLRSSISMILLVFLIGTTATSAVFADRFDVEDIDDTPKLRDLQYPEWFKNSFLDLNEDLAEALEAGKKGIIVYFGQKHCAYCEALLEKNFGEEEDIVLYTRKHFDVIPIDIWGSREVIDTKGQQLTEKVFAEQQDTNFTPSLVFYGEDGKELLKLRGYYTPYKMRGALEYVVDGYHKTESLRDYMARADPPPKFDMSDMNMGDFFEQPPYLLDRSRFAWEKPLVVFFEQRDCHACDILHSEPLHNDETLLLIEGFDAVQLDMWSDTPVITPNGKRITAREWANQLELFYAPSLIFFDERGKEVFRIDSVVRLYRLKGVLEYVLSKGYLDTPTFQRWRENQAR